MKKAWVGLALSTFVTVCLFAGPKLAHAECEISAHVSSPDVVSRSTSSGPPPEYSVVLSWEANKDCFDPIDIYDDSIIAPDFILKSNAGHSGRITLKRYGILYDDENHLVGRRYSRGHRGCYTSDKVDGDWCEHWGFSPNWPPATLVDDQVFIITDARATNRTVSKATCLTFAGIDPKIYCPNKDVDGNLDTAVHLSETAHLFFETMDQVHLYKYKTGDTPDGELDVSIKKGDFLAGIFATGTGDQVTMSKQKYFFEDINPLKNLTVSAAVKTPRLAELDPWTTAIVIKDGDKEHMINDTQWSFLLLDPSLDGKQVPYDRLRDGAYSRAPDGSFLKTSPAGPIADVNPELEKYFKTTGQYHKYSAFPDQFNIEYLAGGQSGQAVADLYDAAGHDKEIVARVYNTKNPEEKFEAKLPINPCVKIEGDGKQRVVFMYAFPKDYKMSGQTLLTQYNRARNIIDYGFKGIDPYKKYQDQFSFYMDLRNINSSGDLDLTSLDTDVDKEIVEDSTCGSKAAVYILLYFSPGSGTAFVLMGGRVAYINLAPSFDPPWPPIDLSILSSNPMSLNIVNNLPRTVIHETSHAFAFLRDEYLNPYMRKEYGELDIFTNCAQRPDSDYSFNRLLYGSLSEKGCRFAGKSRKQVFYRPSHTSIMNGHPTDKTIYDVPAVNKFNVVSCGYVIAAIKGETAIKQNAEKYWDECLGLDVEKSNVPFKTDKASLFNLTASIIDSIKTFFLPKTTSPSTEKPCFAYINILESKNERVSYSVQDARNTCEDISNLVYRNGYNPDLPIQIVLKGENVVLERYSLLSSRAKLIDHIVDSDVVETNRGNLELIIPTNPKATSLEISDGISTTTLDVPIEILRGWMAPQLSVGRLPAVVEPGKEFSLEWSYANQELPHVSVFLMKNSKKIETLASDVTETKRFKLYVPLSISDGAGYFIRIQNEKNPYQFADSQTFSIKRAGAYIHASNLKLDPLPIGSFSTVGHFNITNTSNVSRSVYIKVVEGVREIAAKNIDVPGGATLDLALNFDFPKNMTTGQHVFTILADGNVIDTLTATVEKTAVSLPVPPSTKDTSGGTKDTTPPADTSSNNQPPTPVPDPVVTSHKIDPFGGTIVFTGKNLGRASYLLQVSGPLKFTLSAFATDTKIQYRLPCSIAGNNYTYTLKKADSSAILYVLRDQSIIFASTLCPPPTVSVSPTVSPSVSPSASISVSAQHAPFIDHISPALITSGQSVHISGKGFSLKSNTVTLRNASGNQVFTVPGIPSLEGVELVLTPTVPPGTYILTVTDDATKKISNEYQYLTLIAVPSPTATVSPSPTYTTSPAHSSSPSPTRSNAVFIQKHNFLADIFYALGDFLDAVF